MVFVEFLEKPFVYMPFYGLISFLFIYLIIPPIFRLKNTIREVHGALIIHANTIVNPQHEQGLLRRNYIDCRQKLRALSAKLTADSIAQSIPTFAPWFIINPNQISLLAARDSLMLLSAPPGFQLTLHRDQKKPPPPRMVGGAAHGFHYLF